jgi:hypothetical protein
VDAPLVENEEADEIMMHTSLFLCRKPGIRVYHRDTAMTWQEENDQDLVLEDQTMMMMGAMRLMNLKHWTIGGVEESNDTTMTRVQLPLCWSNEALLSILIIIMVMLVEEIPAVLGEGVEASKENRSADGARVGRK